MNNPVPITWRDDLSDFSKVTYPSEDSAEFYRKDCAPGSCQLLLGDDPKAISIRYVCPCGCGRLRRVPAYMGEKKERTWNWDGNKDKPTLTPSIACLEGCKWHGYITHGEFTTC